MFVCHVRQRAPIAVATLSGTLDASTLISAMVSVRGCLADVPGVLLLDVEHLVVANPATLAALLGVVSEAAEFPGARVGLCGASAVLAAMIAQAAPAGAVDRFPHVDAGLAVMSGRPVVPRLSMHLPPGVEAPGRARTTLIQACEDWRIPGARKVAELIVSELVTNVVLHARTRSTLTLRLVGDRLQIAVRDGDPRQFVRPVNLPGAPPTEEHGRGLLLLEAMATSWGCLPIADGKVIWAYVSTSVHF